MKNLIELFGTTYFNEILYNLQGKSAPKIFKNMNFLDFSDFQRDVYRAHGRHSGSSAMPLAEVIHEIR